MAMEPVQVFLSFAHEDEELAIELEAHLQGMVKQGVIRLWSERQVAFGSNWIAARAHQLESAGLLVFLVSASFLASDLTFASLTTALQRQVSGTARVAPILVRACDWRASPLDALAVIPANQVPVASWPNRDEAWAEVVRELRSLLQFGAAPEESAPPEAPAEIRRIEEIFRTEGQPDITYVEPAQYKTLRRCLRTLGKGLVVEGPSGVGKTTLVSRALDDLRAEPREWLYAQREADRRKLDERLAAGFLGHLVVDDFHRLDPAQQARVADTMKYISDRNTRDAKITVVGINPVGESLVTALRDLAGRFDVVRMGGQPDEKISELIRKGEEAANIRFRRRDEFIRYAAKAGFRLVLHGHIHKAERSLFRYDMTPDGRRLDIVAAGTFGAPTTEWVPGYPLQYNLLRLSKDRIVVETRRREEPNGAWHPDARWLQGPGKDPLPRYAIALSGEPL